MVDRAAVLREQKRTLDAELASVNRSCKRAKRNVADKTRAAPRAWILLDRVRLVVLTLYQLADGVLDPVLVYSTQVGLQYHWGSRTEGELALLVLDAILAANNEELLSLIDETTAPDQVAFVTARQYLHEWCAASWCTVQNWKGIAPASAAVLDRFEYQRSNLAEGSRPRSLGTSGSAGSRKQMCRWRRRFAGRVGVIRVREEIPVAIMRFKVLRLNEL